MLRLNGHLDSCTRDRLPPAEAWPCSICGCRYMNDDRRRACVGDGWTLTGDAFWQDGDGCSHFSARTDDIILSAGYNSAGPEVEAALTTHPAVRGHRRV